MAAKPRNSLSVPLSPCCGRVPEEKEVTLKEAGFDRFEETTLQIMRFFFQSFSCPNSQAWVHALELARANCGEHGAGFAHKVLDAMRAVRCARRSVFTFNSPSCPGCAAFVTEHERRLVAALASIRRGHHGQAQLELMMLCEGNDISDVLKAFAVVADAMPEPAQSERVQ